MIYANLCQHARTALHATAPALERLMIPYKMAEILSRRRTSMYYPATFSTFTFVTANDASLQLQLRIMWSDELLPAAILPLHSRCVTVFPAPT